MPDDESASMSGQTVDDAPTSMTVDDLVDAVSDSVSGALSARLDALGSRLESVAGRAQVDGLSERVDALSGAAVTRDDLATASALLSAKVDEATLQAGELVPIGEDDIGSIIVLVGQLLDAFDSNGDGASDVASLVAELRSDVRDVASALVHPAMTTDFADYTVLEALLLLLFLWQVIKFCLGTLWDGFSRLF